ncbi:unnamed protein product, partial [Meganyctiphanes norvegica]
MIIQHTRQESNIKMEGPESQHDMLKEAYTKYLSESSLLNSFEFDNFTALLFHNLSQLVNQSGGIDMNAINRFETNRRVSNTSFYLLIVLYSVLILVGSIGNSLVIAAVARKPSMRTARNVFIVNLAVADLLVCMVNKPLTLMEILTQYWPLGDTPFLCGLFGTLQATCIFVSTISITAIALDRYHVIVYPTEKSLQKVGVLLTLLGIWSLSLLLALPNYIVRNLDVHNIDLPGLKKVCFCVEDWPVEHGRAYYSIFCIVVQYFVPILTVSVAYTRIANKLKYRMNSTNRSYVRSKKETSRMRRTNTLLMAIALIFCLSWLPLNLFNVIADLYHPISNDESVLIAYAICHMIAMTSACSNPLLYGWLNENFLKEFMEIFTWLCPCCPLGARLSAKINMSACGKVGKKDSSSGRASHKENHLVLYSQPMEDAICNGLSGEYQDPEVTFVSQVMTTTTL